MSSVNGTSNSTNHTNGDTSGTTNGTSNDTTNGTPNGTPNGSTGHTSGPTNYAMPRFVRETITVEEEERRLNAAQRLASEAGLESETITNGINFPSQNGN
ncbi:hypothetical protein P7C73_g4152, partial [Tremellales sp. Uapishka_1]